MATIQASFANAAEFFNSLLETGRWAIPTMRDTYLTFTKDGFVDQIKVIVFGGSGHVDLHRFMPVLMGY
jgi:hypothetical protein